MNAKMDEQPVGPKVDPLPSGVKPDGRPLFGRYVTLEHVSAEKHGAALYHSFAEGDAQETLWTYMGYGPFDSSETFQSWLKEREKSLDPLFYAFVPKKIGEASGMGSFMRQDAPNGVIEIGHIWMSPSLQNTSEGSEAIYLMMRHALEDLGVRRLEWKCDALNAPSRAAADRLGFVFEGIFRQHYVVKGRNRDTAWYSIINTEWKPVRDAFEKWLQPANFDGKGRQIAPLKARR
jgi:RimJ/RimL family protein N-acetyltransferase